MGQEEEGPGGRRDPLRGDDDGLEADYEEEYEEEDEPPLRARRRAPHGPRERIHQGMRELADQLEIAAEHLDDLAGERLGDAEGPLGRAGEVARGVAERMDSVAEYLRTNEVDDVRRGLERRVRASPVRSILVAVAAGWLAGKILR